MIVRYLGHSSFWISSSKATSVIVDPYGTHLPYHFPPVESDIVVISHEHRDHNADYRVGGKPMVVKRTHDFMCEQEIMVQRTGETLTFHGLPTFHDNMSGRQRGPNTIWHWYMEGIHFAHLGDLGHLLTDQQLKFLGKVDVVFVPVGGKITLTPTEASLVISQLEPRLVFPMHYLTPQIEHMSLADSTLKDFAAKMSNVEDAATMAMEIELARLPTQTKVMMLRHE
jgi:L-ascorbate metabolism protein UlaG (beta-lactamase superfamily)